MKSGGQSTKHRTQSTDSDGVMDTLESQTPHTRHPPAHSSALSAPKWGFSDVLFKGQPIQLARPFGCYVMENVLFKISFPAEFHAQTAVEAAIKLHHEYFAERGCVEDQPQQRGKTESAAAGLHHSRAPLNTLDDIERIEIHTHESALRIIDKT